MSFSLTTNGLSYCWNGSSDYPKVALKLFGDFELGRLMLCNRGLRFLLAALSDKTSNLFAFLRPEGPNDVLRYAVRRAWRGREEAGIVRSREIARVSLLLKSPQIGLSRFNLERVES